MAIYHQLTAPDNEKRTDVINGPRGEPCRSISLRVRDAEFVLRGAYCSNGIDARRASRRKVACEKRHRRKQYHNHDDGQKVVGADPVQERDNEVREAERERQP